MQEILKYYLEYEIYNLMSNEKIKIKNQTCVILDKKENKTSINNYLKKLKQLKIEDEVNSFVLAKLKGKKEIAKQIYKELKNLNEFETNKAQITLRIKLLIKDAMEKSINENYIDNFIDELCQINSLQEFYIYAHNLTSVNEDNNQKNSNVEKYPIFIFKCKIDNEEIKVLEVNVNENALNKIISIAKGREFSEIVIEYEDIISNYTKEVKNSIDAKGIDQLLNMFYEIFTEYTGINKKDIFNIIQLKQEYILAIEDLATEGIKNIKEDIETVNKLIEYDNYIPNLLVKYLSENKAQNDINNEEYTKFYRGNYKSEYGVGENQYRIVNSIKNNDLIAIEGPPGTGKTSLLKEIIANNIVERANLIFKNWNIGFSKSKSNFNELKWFNNNKDIVKSIVVTSKNGQAIENIIKGINCEIEYFQTIANEYERTETIGNLKQKLKSNYKGLICLPLGKQDNMLDFKQFLYEQFIPFLQKIQNDENLKNNIEKTKKHYENKCNEIEEFEQIVKSLPIIENSPNYFYGINISERNAIEQINEKFLEEKQQNEEILNKIEEEKRNLINQKEEQNKKLKKFRRNINEKENEIKKYEKEIANAKADINELESKKNSFERISKNFITKIVNCKKYNQYKKIDFAREIILLKEQNKTRYKSQNGYIKEIEKLKNGKNEVDFKIEEIKRNIKINEEKIKNVNRKLQEMNVICEFNKKDKKLYWNYKNMVDLYGNSTLNTLNQELFELAIKLNEAFILKNSEVIIENLKLFMQEDNKSVYPCQKFYDSSNIYDEENKYTIKNIWNILFLCFPVITTTLDSFSKKYFHLFPEYIDLLLIDEAGQIPPHNAVSALYRAQKAVIVGDVNQIPPIYNNVTNKFEQHQKNIKEVFDKIKVDENSIQTIANRNTDILSNSKNIMLTDHYRCERNIINFSTENVYENRLNMHVKDDMNKPFSNNMIAFDIRGKKEKNENLNKAEIEACIETIKYINKNHNEKDLPTIAIITPFKNQKEELEKRLKQEKLINIQVGTVHAFQGQERDYIIFSPVIDSIAQKFNVNFIGQKCNMLNVAVTRAKKQFIFIGNLSVALSTGNYLFKLIKYIKNNGLLYSLYDIEKNALSDHWDEDILKILEPELKIENDNIGLYISQHIKNGIMVDAKQHYEFLKYVIKNAKKEICIMSPWIRKNVFNDEFLDDIIKLKEKNCTIKMVYGYKKGNKNESDIAQDLANELDRIHALGYSTKEEVQIIIDKMYEIIGKDNFIYAPPTHAKVLIVDNKYMCIGSHNWLSNTGKTPESQRAIEGTRLTTNISAISYAKEEFFKL